MLKYIRIIQYRKQEILVTALVTILVTLVGRALIPIQYKASAILRVVPYSTENPSYTQLTYATRIMKTYAEIGSSSAIMSNLREELGLMPTQPASVEIEIIPDTELLRIVVTDYDPVLTSDIANALAAQLINENSIRDIRITLIEPASIPKPPSMLRVVSFYVLIIMVGFLGGFGLAFFLENISPRCYDENDVESASGLQVLGHIPSLPVWRRQKLVATSFPLNHAFQRLAIILTAQKQGKKPCIIMVTSPNQREGKSLVASNLAYSLAKFDYKTLLVDMDVRRPALHRYFRLSNEIGSSDILYSDSALKEVIQQTDLPNLSVIVSGSISVPFKGMLLPEEKTKKILAQFKGEYDYVILDTPAFLGPADGIMLLPIVDWILPVVRLGTTSLDSLEAMIQQLKKMQANIPGLIVNH